MTSKRDGKEYKVEGKYALKKEKLTLVRDVDGEKDTKTFTIQKLTDEVLVFLDNKKQLEFKREPEKKAEKSKPLPHRKRLVATLAKETLADSIHNLPNFDDTVWVKGGLFPGKATPGAMDTEPQPPVDPARPTRRA